MQFLRRLNQFRFKPRCIANGGIAEFANLQLCVIHITLYAYIYILYMYVCVYVWCICSTRRVHYNNRRIHLLILTCEFPREPLRRAADLLQGSASIEHPAFRRAVEYLDRRLAGLRAAKSITRISISRFRNAFLGICCSRTLLLLAKKFHVDISRSPARSLSSSVQ